MHREIIIGSSKNPIFLVIIDYSHSSAWMRHSRKIVAEQRFLVCFGGPSMDCWKEGPEGRHSVVGHEETHALSADYYIYHTYIPIVHQTPFCSSLHHYQLIAKTKAIHYLDRTWNRNRRVRVHSKHSCMFRPFSIVERACPCKLCKPKPQNGKTVPFLLGWSLRR